MIPEPPQLGKRSYSAPVEQKLPQIILQYIVERSKEEHAKAQREKAKRIAFEKVYQVFNQIKNKTGLGTRSSEVGPEDTAQKYQVKPAIKQNSQGKIVPNMINHEGTNVTFDHLRQKPPKIQCPICETENVSLLSLSSCQHMFCEPCLKQYVVYRLNIFQSIHCPHEGCSRTIDVTGKIYVSLKKEQKEKYQRLVRYERVRQNPTLRLCPTANCQGVVQIGTEESRRTMKTASCTLCSKSVCTSCLMPAHGQTACDSSQLDWLQNNLKFRQCNRCKNVIERNEGCKHMTCLCGYQFCYLCGGKWNSSHVCDEPKSCCHCCQCNCCECCECCEFCECCQCQCACCEGDCCDRQLCCGCCDYNCQQMCNDIIRVICIPIYVLLLVFWLALFISMTFIGLFFALFFTIVTCFGKVCDDDMETPQFCMKMSVYMTLCIKEQLLDPLCEYITRLCRGCC